MVLPMIKYEYEIKGKSQLHYDVEPLWYLLPDDQAKDKDYYLKLELDAFSPDQPAATDKAQPASITSAEYLGMLVADGVPYKESQQESFTYTTQDGKKVEMVGALEELAEVALGYETRSKIELETSKTGGAEIAEALKDFDESKKG